MSGGRRIALSKPEFGRAFRLYGQMGALVGAGTFVLVTVLVWPIASIGIGYWLFADAICAAVGAVVGCTIFGAHHEESAR